MDGWSIFVICVGSIFGFLLFLFLVNIVFIGVFLKEIENRKKALIIILTQRYEGLALLIDIFTKNKVEIPDHLLDLFKSIDINYFQDLESNECIKARSDMSLLKQELFSLVKYDYKVLKNSEFKNISIVFSSIDDQTRTVVSSYNAAVIGFNYWIRFKPFKYFYIFNNVEVKHLLS